MRDVLSRGHLHELAIETGFCQRDSDLKPEVFFDLLLYCVSRTENSSLSFMVSYLETKNGITISKQSLDERFTDKAVKFVQAVLQEVISAHLPFTYSEDLLKGFERVLIKDSTKIMAPSKMATNYPGCGGGHPAGISIQYEYDLKSGAIADLEVTPANRNDRADAGQTASNMKRGDLIIRDLGYFSTEVFAQCLQNQTFFLSRLDAATTVYDQDGKQFSFKDTYREMSEAGIVKQERRVFIGQKNRVAVRLILGIVPDTVYEQRIREKTQKSKRQGRGQLTEETKMRCRFTMLITNAGEDLLPMEHVFPLYRLRWQIELNFKCWKSVFKIDKLQKMKEERYITQLLTKLLLIIIDLQITYGAQQDLMRQQPNKRPILSFNKVLKTLNSIFDEIFSLLRQPYREAKISAENIMKRLSEHHWLESKKNKQCLPEIIELFSCKSEK